MPSEQQNVGPPFAERRKPEGHDREAMIEVFAEAPRADGRLQVLARRREHPYIHRLASRAAKTPDCSFLERLQKLHLQRVVHQADLVEKDRPAMCHLQEAGLGLPRVGERAALEAKKLGFEQRLRNGCAVDVHERRSRPWSGMVDDLRDKPLARARLTLNQDGRQASLRGGLTAEQPRQLIADGCKLRARPQQLIQHAPAILTADGTYCSSRQNRSCPTRLPLFLPRQEQMLSSWAKLSGTRYRTCLATMITSLCTSAPHQPTN
jgi:hypothetical protein